jgi:hypothetical protein
MRSFVMEPSSKAARKASAATRGSAASVNEASFRGGGATASLSVS